MGVALLQQMKPSILELHLFVSDPGVFLVRVAAAKGTLNLTQCFLSNWSIGLITQLKHMAHGPFRRALYLVGNLVYSAAAYGAFNLVT